MKKVWVTYGNTDSGDFIGPYVWDTKPSDIVVERQVMNDYGEEEISSVSLWTVEADYYEYK
jgi:hypothetical protein